MLRIAHLLYADVWSTATFTALPVCTHTPYIMKHVYHKCETLVAYPNAHILVFQHNKVDSTLAKSTQCYALHDYCMLM
jgi:hypothetical protein